MKLYRGGSLLDDRHAEVVEDPFFEHFFRFAPANSFLRHNRINSVVALVMGVHNEEEALPKLHRIVHSDDAVGVLIATVHDWTSSPFQVVSQDLAVLHDSCSVRDM